MASGRETQGMDIVDSQQSSPKQLNNSAVSLSPSWKLTKKESLKLQKQSYKMEKKKVENEYKMISHKPAVVLLSDWLKIRSTLKSWSRMWCVLYPGMLILYKNSKEKQWIGTALLSSVEITERPSKKQGMCFKIYHLLNQCIWASKGPNGEGNTFLSSSLPTSYIILRSQTESDGQCWIDALELAKSCSNLLKRSLESSIRRKPRNKDGSKSSDQQNISSSKAGSSSSNQDPFDLADLHQRLSTTKVTQCSVSDDAKMSASTASDDEDTTTVRKVVSEANLWQGQRQGETFSTSSESYDSERDVMDDNTDKGFIPIPTSYVVDEAEELGDTGEKAQVEELEGENKSLVWTLLKQVKPGMDLSKVVLPTFILEPRSFLDKLSDYYYHADLISKATTETNPYARMKAITKWYLSGFYKKPKGLKKPYNPILGETFRCKWDHPETNSSTFFIAEQVSHHPPISALAVINRKDGFTVRGGILAKSKFYGNSISAILDGDLIVTLLNLGEEYRVTLPYAHCKGILYGKMTMEFGGKVNIQCEKTGYSSELEFKLKGLFSGSKLNEVTGRILLSHRVLATLGGCWDQDVHITDLNEGTVENFWSPTDEVKKRRLKRFVVEPSQQKDFESSKLWQHVSVAIKNKDQIEATNEKTKLENEQRKAAKLRKENNEDWIPQYFEYNVENVEWEYKHMDSRPWDTLNDIEQYESDGIISTKTKHKTSPVRSMYSSMAMPTGERANVRRSTLPTSANRIDIGFPDAGSRKLSTSNRTALNAVSYRLASNNGDNDVARILLDIMQPILQNQDVMMKKLANVQHELSQMKEKQNLEYSFYWWIFLGVFTALALYFCRGLF